MTVKADILVYFRLFKMYSLSFQKNDLLIINNS